MRACGRVWARVGAHVWACVGAACGRVWARVGASEAVDGVVWCLMGWARSAGGGHPPWANPNAVGHPKCGGAP